MTKFRRTSKNKQNKQSKNKQSKNKNQTRKYREGGAVMGSIAAVGQLATGAKRRFRDYIKNKKSRRSASSSDPKPPTGTNINLPADIKNQEAIYITNTDEHLKEMYELMTNDSENKEEYTKNITEKKKLMVFPKDSKERESEGDTGASFNFENKIETSNTPINQFKEAFDSYESYLKALKALFDMYKKKIRGFKDVNKQMNDKMKALEKAQANLFKAIDSIDETSEKINKDLRKYRIYRLTKMMESINKSGIRQNKKGFMKDKENEYKKVMQRNLFTDNGDFNFSDKSVLKVHASPNLQHIVVYSQ